MNFAKYAAMFVAQEEMRAQREHDKVRKTGSAWKQLILLPVTGGYSLVKFLLRREG
ncbi:MAG TPA: hypothetical protein VKB26_11230 [Candidatus Acidoferrales bacterium]|nr:hypothetical protein [Candidatus Acidoferrales bacterium]